MRVIIIGAGGHGQVICDALLVAKSVNSLVAIAGFVDDNLDLQGTRILGVPVIGTIRELGSLPHDAVVIAIGDNRRRQLLYARLAASGEHFATVIHPRAIVAPDVVIGPGTMVVAGAVVNTGSRIGANTILNTGCTIDHHNSIGDHAHIGPGAHLGGEVEIGDGTLVGLGSAILPGKKIGSWSLIGAGSLVRDDVPPETTVVGVPARTLRTGSLTRS